MAALFLVFFGAVTAPVWLRRVFPLWDAANLGYPAFAMLADGLRHGHFPLWDPYTNCGYPLYADPTVSAGLNPVAIVAALVVPSAGLGFALYWLVHWAWAGLGAMALARRLGAAPFGGLVAACAYAFSGFFIGHGQHTAFIVTAAWLPWSLAFADAAVGERRPGAALLAGVALGASALGGYPALATFAGLAMAMWLVLRWLTPLSDVALDPRERRRTLAWVAGTLAACAVLLALLWMPALVAFFREGRGYTERVGAISADLATLTNTFPPRALASLAFPTATLEALDAFPSDRSMTNGYLGLLAIPLAATWIVCARPRRALWLAATAVFMLWLSFGGEYGLRTIVYYCVPITRYMRHSGAYRLFWILPLAVAAGCGASAVVRDPGARRFFLRALLAWAGLAALAGVAVTELLPGEAVASTVVLPLVFLLLIVAVVGAKAVRASPTMLAVTLGVAVLVDSAWHLNRNSGTVWTQGRAMAAIERFERRPIAFMPRQLPPSRYGWPPLMNVQQVVRFPVVGGYVTMLSKGFNDVLLRSPFHGVLLKHRFWMAPGRAPSAPDPEALAALARLGPDDALPTFSADDSVPIADPVRPGTYGSVSVVEWAPERIVLRVVSAGGLLASTERYATGWSAAVDGSPVPVDRVNLYFLGARVPPGEHELVLTFGAGPFWILVTIALVGAAAAIAAGVVLEVRRSRPRESAA